MGRRGRCLRASGRSAATDQSDVKPGKNQKDWDASVRYEGTTHPGFRHESSQYLPVLGPIAVMTLFAASCALSPVYYRGKYLEEGVDPPGWWLLATGWMTIPLVGPQGLAWFANPVLAVALVCWWRKKYGKSAVWTGIAVGLSLLPLAEMLIEVPGKLHLQPQVAWVFSTGWSHTEFRSGYFAWVASFVLLFSSACLCWYHSRGEVPAIDDH